MTTSGDSTASGQSTGYGQQTPGTANSAESVAAFQIRSMIAKLEKMKLVQVTAVHGGGDSVAAAGTVDVQLLVCQIDLQGNKSDQGIVYGVPWFRLGSSKGSVVIDPQIGDVGFIVCEDRDITNVKSAVANGASPVNVTPGSRRQNSVSDGIYVGLALAKDATAQYLWFKPAGGFRLLDQFGNKVDTTASGITITDQAGNVVQTAATGITMSDINANQIQMRAGFVNVVTASFRVNGVPVTVP